MSVAALIADMIRAGVDPEIIGRTAEVIAETTKAAPTARQARNRRYYEKKRLNPSEQDASDVSDKKVSPEPSSKNAPSSGPPKGVPSVSPAEPALAEQIWALQPEIVGQTGKRKRRATRPDVDTALKAALRRGGKPAQILAACRAYFAAEADDRGGQYAMGAARLLEADRWRDFLPAEPKPESITDATWRDRIDHWRQTHEWKGPGPPPDQPDCRVPTPILAEYRIAA